MPSLVGTALFWSAAVAVVVAQVMILRSTRRAQSNLRAAGSRPPLLEWSFAFGPALGLAVLLFFSWRAATRPPVIDVRLTPSVGEIRS